MRPRPNITSYLCIPDCIWAERLSWSCNWFLLPQYLASFWPLVSFFAPQKILRQFGFRWPYIASSRPFLTLQLAAWTRKKQWSSDGSCCLNLIIVILGMFFYWVTIRRVADTQACAPLNEGDKCQRFSHRYAGVRTSLDLPGLATAADMRYRPGQKQRWIFG